MRLNRATGLMMQGKIGHRFVAAIAMLDAEHISGTEPHFILRGDIEQLRGAGMLRTAKAC